MKKNKKILVDLSYLKDLCCGYGQIAMNYGNHYKEKYDRQTCDYELTFLLPKSFFGVFGHNVNYISSTNWLRKHVRFLFPKFDIWHSMQYPSVFSPCFRSTKYIFTIHDISFLSNKYEKSLEVVNDHYRRIKRHIQRASVVATVSEFSKNEIERRFDLSGKRLELIYNEVEKLMEKPSRPPRSIHIVKPFFFVISAFYPKKNLYVLLDMMKLMPEKYLYIAGNNNTEYGDRLKCRIRAERISNVHLIGKVSEAEKIWLYENCESILFPSLFEGLRFPVIEAMQFGKPVFSTKGRNPGETGPIHVCYWDNFDPQDMKSLIDKHLSHFYQNPVLADNEKQYAYSFDYGIHFKKYIEIYNNL